MVSAGEASGDMYAAGVVHHLSQSFPDAQFYGCAGPRLKRAGVRPVIDSASLAVVGLAEVVSHLPRIYGQYRKLIRYARNHPPQAAILTDSPDFHLRVARHLKRLNVPIYYLVAPQVWAWRQNRVNLIRKIVDKLFCLFPFEEAWFRERGVDASYIGHPLAKMVHTSVPRSEFLGIHGFDERKRLVTLLPGSRAGEVRRHMPALLSAVAKLRKRCDLSFALATPGGFGTETGFESFREPLEALAIKVIENETWDCIGHADLALAASGTVTIEAAVLGTPMVTFYKVSPLTWWVGRRLVKVPYLSMVNLVADRQVVPELIQDEMDGDSIASAAAELLADDKRAERMRIDLAGVRAALTREGDPLRLAAGIVAETLDSKWRAAHARA